MNRKKPVQIGLNPLGSVPDANMPQEITEEHIRLRAYQIFESRTRDGAAGDPFSDWVLAEQELRREDQSSAQTDEIINLMQRAMSLLSLCLMHLSMGNGNGHSP